MMGINIIDANDQVSEALLEDETYLIGMHWNETAQFWSMSIQDFQAKYLVSGIRCLPGKALTYQFRRRGFPPGELMIKSSVQALTRNSFIDGTSFLLYATAAEMIADGFSGYEEF